MGKKTKYIVGDVFKIELENGLKGLGRILKINEPSIFIELYKIKPVAKIEGFNKEEVFSPILMVWSTNSGLRKGDWTILGNKPINGEVKMPDFYKQDAMNPNKYFIIRGEEKLKVSKDQIGNAQPFGIFGHEAVRLRYAYELKQCGLL